MLNNKREILKENMVKGFQTYKHNFKEKKKYSNNLKINKQKC